MAAAKLTLYRIRSPFTDYSTGVPHHYNDRSIIYTADHPLVKKNLGAFEEVVPVGPPARTKVEETTANPGELR